MTCRRGYAFCLELPSRSCHAHPTADCRTGPDIRFNAAWWPSSFNGPPTKAVMRSVDPTTSSDLTGAMLTGARTDDLAVVVRVQCEGRRSVQRRQCWSTCRHGTWSSSL